MMVMRKREYGKTEEEWLLHKGASSPTPRSRATRGCSSATHSTSPFFQPRVIRHTGEMVKSNADLILVSFGDSFLRASDIAVSRGCPLSRLLRAHILTCGRATDRQNDLFFGRHWDSADGSTTQ